MDAAIARRKVKLLAEFDVATPEVADILAATEDMQDTREIDGLQIVNPFR